jgi:hypothetical protein
MKTFSEYLKSLSKCKDCKTHPYVLLTEEKIPCCAQHWIELCDSRYEWEQNNTPTVTLLKHMEAK